MKSYVTLLALSRRSRLVAGYELLLSFCLRSCRVTAEVCGFEGGFHDRPWIRGDCVEGVDAEANIPSVNIRYRLAIDSNQRDIYVGSSHRLQAFRSASQLNSYCVRK